MARPIKQGIDYFPLDTGFLQDIKVRRILRGCGAQSIAIIISLLGNIYKDQGYYIEWTTDMPFLIADEVGVSEGAVISIIDKAVQVEFFNPDMFSRFNILTSSGIQERFFSAVSKRKEVKIISEFLLLQVNDRNNLIFVGNNSVNGACNKQSKVKESKVKESKVSTTGAQAQKTLETPLWQSYMRNITPTPSLTEWEGIDGWINKGISPEMIILCTEEAAANNARTWRYVNAIIKKCYEENVLTAEQFKARQQLHKNKITTKNTPARSNAKNFAGRDKTNYSALTSQRWMKKGGK